MRMDCTEVERLLSGKTLAELPPERRAEVAAHAAKCAACGKSFEAHRRRTIMSKDGKRLVGFEIKKSGGDWERVKKPPVKCPGCGKENAANLKLVYP
jgi:endogenous inhibitor of DNA gyrase (YacG/DUF329 family)